MPTRGVRGILRGVESGAGRRVVGVANLSWGEIRGRATAFASKWAGASYEKGESQHFWIDFLDVYDIDPRLVGALFEFSTKRLREERVGRRTVEKRGFIDLFWPGKLVAEQKSAGRNLDDAERQAGEYVMAMAEADLPEAIVVSDFRTFRVYNLVSRETVEFGLAELPQHVQVFGFLVGRASKYVAEEDPVNREAAEKMARLHNRLEASRSRGRDLETLPVQLVSWLFAIVRPDVRLASSARSRQATTA